MDVGALDFGLLVLRLLMASVLFAHATQKLFGWFDGAGPKGSAMLFDTLGQRPGHVMVPLAAVLELTAAVSLGLGLLLPVGAAIGIGTMLVAGTSLTQLKGTVWNAAGGGEYPLVLALVLAATGFTGPGAMSLDHALQLLPTASPLGVGLLTSLIGCAAAVAPTLWARRHLSTADPQTGTGS